MIKNILTACCLFLSLVSCITSAAELSGLYGIKFGEVKTGDAVSKDISTGDGAPVYTFKTSKYFMGFKRCYYQKTPLSNKVYRIILVREFDKNSNKKEVFEKVGSVLSHHYKKVGYHPIMTDNPMLLRYDFDCAYMILHISMRRVGISMIPGDLLFIEATSKQYENLYEKEKVEKAVLETDTSAL